MSYSIIYLPKAEKYLTDLDEDEYDRIKESVEEIKKNWKNDTCNKCIS